MSGEIEVPETPNWLQELEAKRENRVKARLGHEAGAGAPCLKCGDSCPGLDLHFWRKCCKICKCSKEEHAVPDDDIYGWAQFQLLGSKPNKIKRTIVLPGKKDEIALEWAPKGHNDTVDKYLKTLPPEKLPVKGSQAAQDRKQLLQKQIPIHDIDPTLCHELTEEELNKMNEYIAHVKQNSVGVGQIVSLSNIIKGKLHMLNPADATILSNRYNKGVPMSEIVKLQAQNKTGSLNHSLDKMSLKNKILPVVNPNFINQTEDNLNPVSSMKIHDKDYPLYSTDINRFTPTAQFSVSLGPKQFDKKLINFDPKNKPSHFVNPSSQYIQDVPTDNSSFDRHPLDHNSEKSAFVPYQKVSSVTKSENPILDDNLLTDPHYVKNVPGYARNSSPSIGNNPNYQGIGNNDQIYENLQDLKSTPNLPNYAPGKYNTFSEIQSPIQVPKNVKDLVFSVYGSDPNAPRDNQNEDSGFRFGKYRQPGSYSEEMPKNSNGFRPIETGNNGTSLLNQQIDKENAKLETFNPNSQLSSSSLGKFSGLPAYSMHLHPSNLSKLDKYGNFRAPNSNLQQSDLHNPQFNPHVDSKSGYITEDTGSSNLHNFEGVSNTPRYDIGNPAINSNSGSKEFYPQLQNENSEGINSKPGQSDLKLGNVGSNLTSSNPNSFTPTLGLNFNEDPQGNLRRAPTNSPLKPGKNLSQMHPSDLKVNEDFLNPSHVNIGIIKDIHYPDIKTATHEVGDLYEEYSPDSIKEILNNVILPDCHYCKKPFEENEFAVSIERADVLFHSGCFKCAGCNQILADNVYFYHKETDNVYCLRDYAKIRGFPRCKACDELIFTKEYCLAENSTFHLKHFCCTECDMPLAGQDYTLEDEMPYCLPCFEQNKASKCNGCGKVIKPHERGCTVKDIHFHADDVCFACKVCKTPLMGKKMLLRNDRLYCSHECFGVDQ